MFNKKDYIPFLIGLFFLGGLVLIPNIWGGFLGMDYEDAFLPSLISCAVFAHAFDQSGAFSFKRFLLVFVVVLGLMSYAAAAYTDRPVAIFLAGGFLGYVVMAGCGWAGILCQRFMPGHSEQTPASESMLLKRNDLAARLVWGVLTASLMVYMVSTQAKNQKTNYYKSLLQGPSYQTYPSQQTINESSLPKSAQPSKLSEIIFLGEVNSSNSGRKTLQAYTSVDDVLYMKIGDPVSLAVENQKPTESRFAGRIALIDPSVDPVTRKVRVVVDIIDVHPRIQDGVRMTATKYND